MRNRIAKSVLEGLLDKVYVHPDGTIHVGAKAKDAVKAVAGTFKHFDHKDTGMVVTGLRKIIGSR